LRLAAPAPAHFAVGFGLDAHAVDGLGRPTCGRIAHEINTPIQFVADNAQVADDLPKLSETIPLLTITGRGWQSTVIIVLAL
jgi:hypothetical protein